MEYLDLYDENKCLTGERILRTKYEIKLSKDRYINIVIIFIKNKENKFLIQLTSKEKGNVWATTGGHVKSGETSKETIVNEVKEELGIDISNDNYILVETQKHEFVFQDVYYLEKDINIEDIKLQEEEVQSVKWLSINQIKKLIKNNKFRKSNIKAFENLLKEIVCKKN